MIRRFNTVLLNVGTASHRFSAKNYQLIPVRCVRIRNSNEGKSESNGKDDSDSNNSKQDTGKQDIPQFKELKFTKIPKKQLITMFLVSFGATSLITYFMVKSRVGTNFEADAIPFDHFVEKFLKVGEVKQITYFAKRRLAIAQLHEGAIIDGKPYGKPGVIVKYDHPSNGIPDQFQSEIRRIEDKLQIRSSEAVPIYVGPEVTGFKLVEGLIGVTIIAVLIGAYIRVAARRLAQQNPANKAKNPFQKPK